MGTGKEESALDSPNRNVECLSDLFVGKIFAIMKQQHGAELVAHGRQRGLNNTHQLVVEDDGLRVPALIGNLNRRLIVGAIGVKAGSIWSSAELSRSIDAQVVGNAEKPGPKRRPTVEATERLVGADENFLRDVGGVEPGPGRGPSPSSGAP